MKDLYWSYGKIYTGYDIQELIKSSHLQCLSERPQGKFADSLQQICNKICEQ